MEHSFYDKTLVVICPGEGGMMDRWRKSYINIVLIYKKELSLLCCIIKKQVNG